MRNWSLILFLFALRLYTLGSNKNSYELKQGNVAINITVLSIVDSSLIPSAQLDIYYHSNSNERFLKDGTLNKDYVPACEFITTIFPDKYGAVNLTLKSNQNYKVTFKAANKIPQSFFIDTRNIPSNKRINYASIFYMKSCEQDTCYEDSTYYRIVGYSAEIERLKSRDVASYAGIEALKHKATIDFTDLAKTTQASLDETAEGGSNNLIVLPDKIGWVQGSDTFNIIDNRLQRQSKWRLFSSFKALISNRTDTSYFEGNYANDAKEGKWLVKTSKGKNRLSLLFKNGRFDEQVEVFDASEKLNIRANFDTLRNHFVGDITTYYQDGSKQLQLHVNDSAKKEGTQLAYYSSGSLAVVSTYKNNVRDGVTLLYTTNGNLGAKQTYKEGKLVEDKKFVEAAEMKEATQLLAQIDNDFSKTEAEVARAIRNLKMSEEEYISTISAQYNALKTAKNELENQQQLMLKTQQELDIEKLNGALNQEALIKTKIISIASIVAFLLSAMLLFVAAKRAKERKATNELLTHKNQQITEKSKELLDSITYAKRLQDAVLPSQQMVQGLFEESFLFFKPKDIVSGDFYWAEETADFKYMAIADSTGHGVPGAMVSMICHTALTRSLIEFKQVTPGEILNKTAELVTETFNKSAEVEVKDGMDISLVCWDKVNKQLTWAGANNGIYWVKNNEVQEIKGDKQSIGLNLKAPNFTTHILQHQPNGTTFYMTTDGIIDQFGGEKGKKFKSVNFKKELLAHHAKPIAQQASIFPKVFAEWKGDYDQVDDVSLFAFRV